MDWVEPRTGEVWPEVSATWAEVLREEGVPVWDPAEDGSRSAGNAHAPRWAILVLWALPTRESARAALRACLVDPDLRDAALSTYDLGCDVRRVCALFPEPAA